jgi:hypothetical protein
MFKRWANNLGALVALLLVVGLFLIIVMVGANFLQPLLVLAFKDVAFAAQKSVQATYTVRTYMNFYYIICGILFLGFFFLMDYRLITTGVPRKLVLRRTSFALGVELVVLALIHLGTILILPAAQLQVVLTAVEILVGIGLIFLSRRKGNILPWVKESR